MAKKKAKEKKPVVTPLDGTPPTCPTGYYWNGSACVLDVGK